MFCVAFATVLLMPLTMQTDPLLSAYLSVLSENVFRARHVCLISTDDWYTDGMLASITEAELAIQIGAAGQVRSILNT